MSTISDIQRYLAERSGMKTEEDDEKEQFVDTEDSNSRQNDGLRIETGADIKGAKTEKKVHKAKFISFSPSKSSLAPITPTGPPIFILGLDDTFLGITKVSDGVPVSDLRKTNASKNKKMMKKNKDNF